MVSVIVPNPYGGQIDTNELSFSPLVQVAEFDVSAKVDSVDITDLDLNADGGLYMFLGFMQNDNTTDASDVLLYVNDDTTASNYNSQQLYTSSTTVSSQRNNTAKIGGCWQDGSVSLWGYIMRDYDGYVKVVVISTHRKAGDCLGENRFMSKNATVTNVTKLTFSASATDGWGVGSKIRLFKVLP